MNKLVALTAICLLSLTVHAQEINDNLRKQHLNTRGPITAKDWVLRGAVKSVKECTYGYDASGRNTTTFYCTEMEFSRTGLLLKRSMYSSKEKNTPDSRYYYSNNRLDSITGFQKKVYHYDEESRLQKISSYGYYDGNSQTVITEETFGYNKKGMIISNAQNSLSDKTLTQSTYAYNKNGHVTEQHMVSPVIDILYQNEFDNKGQLYKTRIIYAKTPEQNNFCNMELNPQGDISAMTSSSQKTATVRTYQYEYDAQGNWLKQAAKENDKPQYTAFRTITYYLQGDDILTTTATNMPVVKAPLLPAEVIDSFVAALDQQQFSQAYNYCTGGRWGTVAQFSATNAYGGITAARMLKMEPTPSVIGQTTIPITATMYVEDPTNGSGTFVQQFQLQKKGDDWKIAGIKLISSTRAVDNWNLNVAPPADFTEAQVLRLAKPVYDTVSMASPIGSDNDRMERHLDTMRFFKDDKTLYCLAVFATQGPEYGASTGWCDVLVFSKTADKWKLQTFLLNAGGGGMYGYSGHFAKLLRIGDEHLAIVLKGGLTHMGENRSWADLVALHQGKLTPLTHIDTDFEYDNGSGEDHIRCYETRFRFEKNGKRVYDLLLEHYNCNSKAPLKKFVIPYNNGYKVPALE